MKKILQSLLLLCCTIVGREAAASHLLGGEIGYEYISATTTGSAYEVTVRFFADCSSTSAALPALIGATPYVSLYNNGTYVSAQYLVYDSANSDIEITPVCPDDAGNTKCTDINNTLPGIKLYTYHAAFTLTGTSSSWKFQFGGSISLTPTTSNAGRTPLIGNANVQAGSSLMYLEATLDNTVYANSSPEFTSVPTPFFCLNKAQTYNLGAIDPDGDILAYNLVAAKESLTTNVASPTDIAYYSPYTATAPVPSATGTFSFSGTSGQLNFLPNSAVNSVVVTKVTETRNGSTVGTSMREMAFLILTSCPNQGPSGPIVNLNNGNADTNDSTIINSCENGGNISFSIAATDPEGDNITIGTINLMSGATANVVNNGTANPVLNFNWNISNMPTGDYVFLVTLKDDGCPISVTQTIAYTIRINPTYEFGKDDKQYVCEGETYLFYGRYYYQTGLYDTVFTSVSGCDSIYYLNLQVNPKPDMTLNQGNGLQSLGICPDEVLTASIVNAVTGYTYQWYKNGVSMPGETSSSLAIATAGTYSAWGMSDFGCVDSSNKLTVSVYPKPEALITSIGDTVICAYDTLSLKGSSTDGDDFRWEPAKPFRIVGSADGEDVRGVFAEPTWVTLTVYNQYGCFDTAMILVPTKPCCEVFVPNAFSPNGDGLNDYFKPSLQSGQVLLTMRVFDRWGKEVYNNTNVKQGWDGLYPNGAEATSDTYMYYIEYTCADGKLYSKKEAVNLVR
ncbi:MAG: gliding motility-associated C-terminal domain-containing protein [Edaphocola sp.]